MDFNFKEWAMGPPFIPGMVGSLSAALEKRFYEK
jgi:hypothetical protein